MAPWQKNLPTVQSPSSFGFCQLEFTWDGVPLSHLDHVFSDVMLLLVSFCSIVRLLETQTKKYSLQEPHWHLLGVEIVCVSILIDVSSTSEAISVTNRYLGSFQRILFYVYILRLTRGANTIRRSTPPPPSTTYLWALAVYSCPIDCLIYLNWRLPCTYSN